MDFADETPILNQLLIDKGWVWCYRHHMAESFSQWATETAPEAHLVVLGERHGFTVVP